MKKILIPGFILGLVAFLEYVLTIMDILPQSATTILIILPVDFIIFFYLLKWVKRKYYSNYISFKGVFTNGILIGLCSTIILGAFIFVYFSYIDPSAMNFVKKIADSSKQETIESQGYISKADEKSINTISNPAVLALNSLFSIVYWIVFSLIVAPILKSKQG